MGTLLAFMTTGDPVAALLAGVALTLLCLLAVTCWIAFEIGLTVHRSKRAKRARDRFRF